MISGAILFSLSVNEGPLRVMNFESNGGIFGIEILVIELFVGFETGIGGYTILGIPERITHDKVVYAGCDSTV